MANEDEPILRGPRVDVPKAKEQLVELLLQRIRGHGGGVALAAEVDGVDLTITFPELLKYSFLSAKFLREHDVHIGDTVMICCECILEFAPIFMGTLILGAAYSPVYPASNESDFAHLLGVIEPKLVVCDVESHPTMTRAATRIFSATILIVRLEDITSLFQNDGREVEEITPVVIDDLDNHVSLVMTSSGTTGRPKGAEIRDASISSLFKSWELPPSFTGLVTSGPYWSSAMVILLIFMYLGGKLVLLGKFSEKKFCDVIKKHQVNFTSIGTNLVVALAKWSSEEKPDLSSLMFFGCHGGRISPDMLDLAEKKLSVTIMQTFGMTEVWSTLTPAFGRPDKRRSVGSLAPNVDGKVVDVETGKPLGPNCEGEICFRSPITFKGYRKNPQATKDLFDEDGFYHTGDVGFYDEEGYFYIVDRIKDLIKYKLMHVPAVEIEQVLLEHPDVLEAAVVGIPHEDEGERATAFVVTRPESAVSAEDLVQLVQGRLSLTKWLHGGVQFIASLPRTHTGKLKKRELRAMFVTTTRQKL